ncbi:MAG: DNA mismatch repair protein MutS [Haloquadratum sp. J07HQX50]|nr:MAG: DNA mismatch repair protein MutS [Haloquadratum sp. J07HQX50]
MPSQGIVEEFFSLRAETDADVLAMQVGDFYEFFADDAEFVAKELELKISQKSSHGASYPMAGVPVTDLTPYLKILVERGFRVAVADQFESENGSHHREITRVVTPGTLLQTDESAARYIAAVVREQQGSGYGVAFAEVTTGQFMLGEVASQEALEAELTRFDPVEILLGPSFEQQKAQQRLFDMGADTVFVERDPETFAPGRARKQLRDQFGSQTLQTIGVHATTCIRAGGAVLQYIEETGTGVKAAITRLQTLTTSVYVELDETTRRNLELTETMQGETRGVGTLIETIDHTGTSAGRRLLREWITRPRQNQSELTRRGDEVQALARTALVREQLTDILGESNDLERLSARAASGSAKPTDVSDIRDTLQLLPEIHSAISSSELSETPLNSLLDELSESEIAAIREELATALEPDPPDRPREGGVFKHGYDAELDTIREQHEHAQQWMDELAAREKEAHGLSHVSVDRNKTDGYYIQVGKSVADEVPSHYREIKTLKSSKRFVTDELLKHERELLQAEESRGEREAELFDLLRTQIGEQAEVLQQVGRMLAEIDVCCSLATHAVTNNWTRPTLTDARELSIEQGRHPVVEQTTEFVPNDIHMDSANQFLIVTGPNMSGKSTYMRQAALITLLAQIGSFVPASNATVGVVDGIYTRVGALDELAQGRSTFMVEMEELANILHSASDNSLVILDEVGRGTATYDGISIAWAATEYLSGARAATASPLVLFATHYHELTGLASHVDGIKNVHVAADESDGDVTFLRTVKQGPADRSYGIHVAELAGVPDPVVDRAEAVLENLRAEEAIEVASGSGTQTQQVVFDVDTGEFQEASPDGGESESTIADEICAELDQIDLNSMSPLEVMQCVERWQSDLSASDER